MVGHTTPETFGVTPDPYNGRVTRADQHTFKYCGRPNTWLIKMAFDWLVFPVCSR